MSMTKTDYELIAEVFSDQIKTWRNVHGNNERALSMEILADALADKLKADNKQFKRDRFLEACGIETEHSGHEYGIEQDDSKWCHDCETYINKVGDN